MGKFEKSAFFVTDASI